MGESIQASKDLSSRRDKEKWTKIEAKVPCLCGQKKPLTETPSLERERDERTKKEVKKIEKGKNT